MSYSIWDKQPELILPKIPFEFLAGLAEKRDKQLNEVDSKIGELKGKFASLVAAPGHEDLATGLTTDYNTKINDWYEKYKSNPLSREGSRELSSLASQFANDQKVQTVVKSRQFYEKFEPKMWEELSKTSYINAPGILNDDGSFNQNTQTYDMSKFQLVSQADWNTPIQKQFAIKHAEIAKKYNQEPVINPVTGEVSYTMTTDTEREWKDPNTFKDVVKSIEYQIMDSPTTDPGYLYLKETARRQHPGDEKAQREYVRERIKNSAVPYYYDIGSEKTTIKEADKSGSGSSGTPAKTPAIKGSRSTVSVDPIMDLQGNIINSKELLDGARTEATANVTKIEGGIKQEFPELANVEFVSTPAGKEIDFSKIKDSQQLSRARELNAQYISAQAHSNSLDEMQTYFMEKAGFNPDVPLLNQVTIDSKLEIYNDGIEFLNKNISVLENLAKTEDDKKLINTIAEAEALTSGNYTEDQIRNSYEKALDAYQKLTKSSDSRLRDSAASFYMAWKNLETSKLNEDPKYQKYTELLNNYLESPVYREEFNYTPLSEDEGELRTTVLNAKDKGLFERRSIDSNKPALSAKDRKALLEDPDFWEKGTMTIRFDQSRNDFVVDLSYKGDVIEIPGIQDLGKYVQKIDPTMSNSYLTKQKNFFDGLDMTNGRASTVQVYTTLPDGTQQINYPLPVKSVYEAVPGIVGANDYLFKIKELNPDNVIVAKSFYDIAMFMDAYNKYKVANLPEAEMTQKVNALLQNPEFQITVVDGKQGKVNQKYFPTWKATLQAITEKEKK